MNIFSPDITSLQQVVRGRLEEGDTASAAADAPDPRLMESLAGSDFGAGFSWPLLVSAAAIDAIFSAASSDLIEEWRLTSASIQWIAKDQTAGRTTAKAEVTSKEKERVRFRVEGRSGEVILYRGDIVFSRYHSAAKLPDDGELFRVVKAPGRLAPGDAQTIVLDFKSSARLDVCTPFGHGLRLLSSRESDVAAGLTKIEIIADRPHEVNLGLPWKLHLAAENGGARQTAEIEIEVPDPQPGRIFYILTEDCETFDGGPLTGNYGDAAVFGNHNNFMDPEDYLVQMVAKPSRMNQIADKHGARWTHFWAAPQRFGADWANGQSVTGAWEKVVEALDSSIQAGSIRHEYAPHLHCDYEPDSSLPPQPRLIYDPVTDGILPNDYYDPIDNPTHRHHDWDGHARGGPGIKALGSWDDVNTKTGSLFKSLNYVAREQAASRHTLIGRTGSYDFGGNACDQEISTKAYEAVGLRANSDTRITNEEPIPGGHMFWCARNDRHSRISRLEDAALVQLAVTRDFSFNVVEDVNGWFEKHWPSCQGSGVHALSLMTHAMFMRGLPDAFRSLEGGSFEVLDRHLEWVRNNYPEVEFATATDVVTEFLDYYSPTIIGIVDSRLIGGEPERGRFLFSIRLLGRGIHVDAENPAKVRLLAPALFRPSDVRGVIIRHGSEVLTRADGYAAEILMTSRLEPLTCEVQVEDVATAELAKRFGPAPVFHDLPEKRQPDLLRMKRVSGNAYSLERLLLFAPAMKNSRGLALALLGIALSKRGSFPVSADMEFQEPVSSGTDFTLTEAGTEMTFSDVEGKSLAKASFRFGAMKPIGKRVREALRLILKA